MPIRVPHKVVVNLGTDQTINNAGVVTVAFMVKNPALVKPQDITITTQTVAVGDVVTIVNQQKIRNFTNTLTSTPAASNANWFSSTNKFTGEFGMTWTYNFDIQE